MMLTGGVVFSILTKYKARSVSSKERTTGARSGNSEPEMMAALVEAVAPGTETNLNSLKSNTSGYKNCECNGTKNIPFDDPDVISDYQSHVEQEYSLVVNRMKKFTDNFITWNEEQRNILVSDLVTAVYLDQTIGEESFYVLPSGEGIKKQELTQSKEVTLETLLVGIMYFILTERSLKNEKGLEMLKFMKTKECSRLRVKCVPLVEEPSEEGKERRMGKSTSGALDGTFDDNESGKDEEKKVDPEIVEVVEPRRDDRGNTFINNGNGPQIGTVYGNFNYFYPGGEKDGK